ncbi:DNA polymerase III subunit epsilon [Corynebacterium sp.]|uniref:DNA polymerase III subunit epsilon n=1 Tax=Corynebacterium sp. TaxID=1720 RepID=UPI0026DDB83D|nr:DNA polymerase III subunit epsilon [Corynebacterium sp.]MDO4609562.1 DNA polymerase III subunit epsilon [Corynebacterium sp.]
MTGSQLRDDAGGDGSRADAAGSGAPSGAGGSGPRGHVAVVVRASGIHPRTSRLVALGILAYGPDGIVEDEWHSTFTVGEDPGPAHLHGLTPEDLEGSPRFGTKLAEIAEFVADRDVVTHNLPMNWGFVIEEARRARRQAGRAGRNRRGRGRRPRSGPMPAPATVTDTLATTRRQGMRPDDRRLFGVARAYGIPAPSPVASTDNIGVPERERTMLEADVLRRLHLEQLARAAADPALAGTIATWAASDLRSDSHGLQRSSIRVDAMNAPRPLPNPGVYERGGRLEEGMEFALAPEVLVPADELIAAGVAAGLAYSEKVTRETSVLVCNQPADVTPDQLHGKAMHAHRKGIPLVSDEAFLRLAGRLRDRVAARAAAEEEGSGGSGGSGGPSERAKA